MKKRGRPVTPMMQAPNSPQHVSLYVPRETLARLDRWREQQFVAPARTAAVRRIIENFLDREEKAK